MECTMLLGIMSDSHNRVSAVKAALRTMDELGVSQVIHCGDVGGEEVFDEFIDRDVTLVWGNTDRPTVGILEYLNTIGVRAPVQGPAVLQVLDRRIAVFHGHEPGFDSACREAGFDYLMHGHTHATRDERVGSMRIINPGALHRAPVKSLAILDPRTDELHFITLEGC